MNNVNVSNSNNNNNNNIAQAQAQAQAYHPLAYRNELYDRTYDIPRKQQNQQNPDVNRVRYANYPRNRRQRSFDDTESYQYAPYPSDYARNYENMYERVKEEEPEYQNTAGRYGRLDIIGHGIGRIERHLSSSCGNIDHYSLGGHYAVLGHSHLGTVGHIRLNPAASQPNSKDSSSAKSFFSCLGGENSQSMTNIDRAGNETGNQSSQNSTYASIRPNSGAIPKQSRKQQQAQKQTQSRSGNEASTSTEPAAVPSGNQSPQHNSGTLNRISKSSLQWLLVNKWLPLWAGEGPDYKIIDFNFMFSRKCEGCDEQHSGNNQGLLRFQGQAEMRPHVYDDYIDTIPPPREYPTINGHYPRVIRPVPQQLSRLNETGECRPKGNYEDLYDRPRARNFHERRGVFDGHNNNEPENPSGAEFYNHDPFRNWAFNFDDNTFKPAGRQENRYRDIRRITDGTFPKESSPPGNSQNRKSEAAPSTSRTESNSASSSQSGSVSSVVQLPINGNNSNSSNENDEEKSSVNGSDNEQ